MCLRRHPSSTQSQATSKTLPESLTTYPKATQAPARAYNKNLAEKGLQLQRFTSPALSRIALSLNQNTNTTARKEARAKPLHPEQMRSYLHGCTASNNTQQGQRTCEQQTLNLRRRAHTTQVKEDSMC